MEQHISITPEETAELAPKVARLEGLAEGYAQAIQAAKQMIVKDFLEKRQMQTHGTIAESQHEHAADQPRTTVQPISPPEPAGTGDEPERADVPQSDPSGDVPWDTSPVFPRAGAEPWLERAFAGDDGQSGNGK